MRVTGGRLERTNRLAAVPLAGLLVGLFFLSCGKRGSASVDTSQPEPSASVISVAVAMGECEDMVACARECDAGKSDRCRRMGVNYEFGKRVERDEVEATTLYAHACEMDNSEGCLSAGRMYEFHHGVAKDDARAVSFYRLACDKKNAAGCANLAVMLENGRGVEKDLKQALELYEGACKSGAGLACDRMKSLSALLNADAGP
jgi:TPR repeat protein